jgi:hypothetical protein
MTVIIEEGSLSSHSPGVVKLENYVNKLASSIVDGEKSEVLSPVYQDLFYGAWKNEGTLKEE